MPPGQPNPERPDPVTDTQTVLPAHPNATIASANPAAEADLVTITDGTDSTTEALKAMDSSVSLTPEATADTDTITQTGTEHLEAHVQTTTTAPKAKSLETTAPEAQRALQPDIGPKEALTIREINPLASLELPPEECIIIPPELEGKFAQLEQNLRAMIEPYLPKGTSFDQYAMRMLRTLIRYTNLAQEDRRDRRHHVGISLGKPPKDKLHNAEPSSHMDLPVPAEGILSGDLTEFISNVEDRAREHMFERAIWLFAEAQLAGQDGVGIDRFTLFIRYMYNKISAPKVTETPEGGQPPESTGPEAKSAAVLDEKAPSVAQPIPAVPETRPSTET